MRFSYPARGGLEFSLTWGYPTMHEEAEAQDEAGETVFSLARAQDHVAEVRAALAAAASPEEQLGILADLTDAASCLACEGDEAAGLAGECADNAIAGLARIRADFPAASEAGLVVLYLLAQASWLRHTGSDLDDEIGYLRDLRGLLPADDPDLCSVELDLAQALIERGQWHGLVADLGEVVTILTHVLGWMDQDDPGRAALLTTLAVYRATRYSGLNGPADDRDAALSHAEAGLTATGAAAETTAICHLVTAWMTLSRQLSSAYRSAWIDPGKIENARRGGPESAEILASLTETTIDIDDAETALSHLGQVRETGELDYDLREMVGMMACLATLNLIRAGRFTGDITELADELRRAALRRPPDDLFRGELLAMRAALIGADAEGGNDRPATGHASGPEAAHILQDATAHLPPRHLLRPALLDQLGRTFGRRAVAATAADDATAEAEQLVTTLERLPPDDPEYARILTVMAINVLQLPLSRRGAVPMARLSTRLEQAVAKLPADDPLKVVGEAMIWAIVFARGVTEHQPEQCQQATEGLIQIAENTPAGHPFRPFAYFGVASAFFDQATMTGELRLMERSRSYLNQGIALLEAVDPAPELEPGRALLFYLRALTELFALVHQPERADASQAVSDLRQAVDLIPPDHPLRPRIVADLDSVRVVQRGMASDDRTPNLDRAEREAAQRLLATAQDLRRDHPDFPLLAAQAAGALMMQGVADHDPKPVDQAIALLADACTVPGLIFRERPRLLDALGFGLLTRYDLTRQPRDLSNAIDRLEEARRAVEQETASPYAANVLRSLASAYRTRGDAGRGDVDRAGSVGLAALREHAGDVLLQDTDEHALSAARRMITDADEMTRWSLERGRGREAIDALELGRGTVLHAATAGAGLADILRDAGYGVLAAEWSQGPATSQAPDTEAGSDLRYRIMTAIEGSAAEARLLAPPQLEDIAAALQRRGIDALVYLLPRDHASPGMAITVYPSGVITPMPLPSLQTEHDGPARAYVRALQAVNQTSLAGKEAALARWRPALDDVCDWAWRTVIRPLLGAVPRRDGGLRRIVLVPTAELGLVPWHAARERAGDDYRYACQEAVFSYAASARQFVDTSRLEFRPWTQAPVLISDAAASSYATEIGISYLQTALYPRAAVYGRAYQRLTRGGATVVSGSDAATPDNVTDSLPHRGPGGEDSDGASMLHFGGHGQARPPVLSSAIQLDNRKGPETEAARAAPRTVAVREILQRARSRLPSASGGLVVLASCLTDVTGADYDEALTLATAFLSAGAAGVVAARWLVPEADTAVFMLMFHQLLNGQYPDPAAALRATQLWMLDPGRSVPADWPNSLRGHATEPALAGPEAWAGFTYQGR